MRTTSSQAKVTIVSPPPNPSRLSIVSARVRIKVEGTSFSILVPVALPSGSVSFTTGDTKNIDLKLDKDAVIAALQQILESETQKVLAIIGEIVDVMTDPDLTEEERQQKLAQLQQQFIDANNERNAVKAALEAAQGTPARFPGVVATGMEVSVTGDGYGRNEPLRFSKPIPVGKR